MVAKMIEEWRNVVGYEGLYEVSNSGRVIRVERYKQNHSKLQYLPRIELKPQIMQNGYVVVYLTKNKKSKIQYIHRLVALAFIPNPENLPEVNHKDENKANNNVNNLEWCDRIYNANYGTAIARRAANTNYSYMNEVNKKYAREHSKRKQRSVSQYSLNGKKIGEYASATIAAEALGHNEGDIINCCRNNLRTTKGYIWRYTEEPLTDEHLMWCNEYALKPVVQYTKDGILIKIWDSAKAAQDEIGVHQSGIRRCCIDKQKTAGKYIWRYVDDDITKEYLEWCNSHGNNKATC